ncbi:unnamed protein product [Scytosiphon promiscuus]
MDEGRPPRGRGSLKSSMPLLLMAFDGPRINPRVLFEALHFQNRASSVCARGSGCGCRGRLCVGRGGPAPDGERTRGGEEREEGGYLRPDCCRTRNAHGDEEKKEEEDDDSLGRECGCVDEEEEEKKRPEALTSEVGAEADEEKVAEKTEGAHPVPCCSSCCRHRQHDAAGSSGGRDPHRHRHLRRGGDSVVLLPAISPDPGARAVATAAMPTPMIPAPAAPFPSTGGADDDANCSAAGAGDVVTAASDASPSAGVGEASLPPSRVGGARGVPAPHAAGDGSTTAAGLPPGTINTKAGARSDAGFSGGAAAGGQRAAGGAGAPSPVSPAAAASPPPTDGGNKTAPLKPQGSTSCCACACRAAESDSFLSPDENGWRRHRSVIRRDSGCGTGAAGWGLAAVDPTGPDQSEERHAVARRGGVGEGDQGRETPRRVEGQVARGVGGRVPAGAGINRFRVMFSTAAVDGAAAKGHLKVIRWLYRHRLEGGTTAAIDAAAANGHLHVLEWLTRHTPLRPSDEHEPGKERRSILHLSAVDKAAANGHLGVVRWFHHRAMNGSAAAKEDFTYRLMDEAASNGHLQVCRWLREHRSEGVSWNAFDGAAAGGHTHVLDWLYRHYPDVGPSAVSFAKAAKAGHLHVIEWLLRHFPGEAEAGCMWASQELSDASRFVSCAGEQRLCDADPEMLEVVGLAWAACRTRFWNLKLPSGMGCGSPVS